MRRSIQREQTASTPEGGAALTRRSALRRFGSLGLAATASAGLASLFEGSSARASGDGYIMVNGKPRTMINPPDVQTGAGCSPYVVCYRDEGRCYPPYHHCPNNGCCYVCYGECGCAGGGQHNCIGITCAGNPTLYFNC